MKVLDIPATVPVSKVRGRGGVEVELHHSFVQFLTISMEAHEPCGKGAKNIRQYDKVMTILEAVTPETTVLQFEDADLDLVKAAVEAFPWIPSASRAMLSYYDAMEKAQDVKTPTKT